MRTTVFSKNIFVVSVTTKSISCQNFNVVGPGRGFAVISLSVRASDFVHIKS